ncbi:MAG: hypothetical protein ACOCUL_05150, partial [Bacteroidota bacterium]
MEKLRIWFNSFTRAFIYHLLFWYIAFLFYFFLTGEKQLFINYLAIINVNSVLLNTLFLSLFLAILFTFLDSFFSDRLLRNSPVRLLTVLRSILYFIIVFLIFIVASTPLKELLSAFEREEIQVFMPQLNMTFFRLLVYFYLACFLN